MLQIRALPLTLSLSQRPFQSLIPPSSSPLGINYNFNFPSKPFPLTPTKHFPIPFAFHSHTHTQTQTTGPTATVNHEAVVVVVDSDTDTSNGHNDLRFVDVGHLIGLHGFQGQIRVKPITDFPELRFSNPGKRWLKLNVLDGERVQQVELEQGWEQPGQNCWVLRFRGIDTVEQAKMLIGATLLVTEEDRPELEEGEVYTRDLIGMRVIMKENGKRLGTVINVFDNGANDLLQISLDSYVDMLDRSGKSMPAQAEASDQLVLVPFVEAIVPDVDLEKREMHITPPKGLLELNLRFDDRSKKERRQLEWKERKKFQKRLIAAKKKLCEMEQEHVFHGFRYGEKEQWSLLRDQIVGVNSKLLQEALQSLEQPAKRWNAAELVSAAEAKLISTMQVSEESFLTGSKDKLVRDINMQEKGSELISKGKMAIVLLLNEEENPDIVENEATDTSTLSMLQKLLCGHQKFVKVKDRESVPLILVSSAQQIQSLRYLFTSNNYFAFDSKKVWFLEEEKLPVLSSLLEGQNKYKLLMKSPWEILQSPIGSGGFICLFSKHGIADNLINMGVEYVELCCPSERIAGGNSLLLGLVNSREAKVGIQISPTLADPEKNFDMIFSMDFVDKLTKQSSKLQFDAIPKANSFVEKVDEDWVTVTSPTPNSYELSCSVYSSLNLCPLHKVCIVEVRE